ncbi:MAG TPA: 16S rRNA (cytidine(1402)-2'-O)-methyltransferase [Leptospiraceae bacterium]|nr:16S rRNA (cytidine(1402)-2'-O)-methyltransferase [Leptospiraceae bacterium]HMW07262.1 16S rRNA (cytidine(1402)-2'-O)-methyltransferase [Leptospiraceae bacterium]HMX34215.1 16S rRNA (cytidine(1402)-2'-O)-methyltransferase [Leptospiraceae bacterium]HMY32920.1 16S rRNA (cytidine(1402)-2'-O)-methyltransferase [Leptospiraceae bacterium]HMZ66067.1 16S rRNA (cytidine(1402)-2'-O)-methyltransferase [Leptospiraceae bacterium]
MKNGSLYIVGTPIGNLEDITLRAIKTLNQVDLILCENAKNSQKLLNHHQIKTPYKTLFTNTDSAYDWIIEDLKSGKEMAYISDAGTPGVSDPGAGLVRSVRKAGISIVPIPGASALTSMLSISGYQTNPTYFLGFLSEKPNKKRTELAEYTEKDCVIVFYESVYKIKTTLSILQELFPDSEILIGRELTKIHEEILLYKPEDLPIESITLKGEFVLLINNHRKKIAKEKIILTDT